MRKMRVALGTLSLALVLAGAAAAGTTTKTSGLRGLVTRGPITPVCVVEQPCSEPAPYVTLLFSRNGRVVGRTVTNGEGRYRLRLAAGLYSVKQAGPVGTIGRGLEPDHARVRAGRFLRVDFSIDTGIR
jgi:hypothetical protein